MVFVVLASLFVGCVGVCVFFFSSRPYTLD
jgi:hypothetical protein